MSSNQIFLAVLLAMFVGLISLLVISRKAGKPKILCEYECPVLWCKYYGFPIIVPKGSLLIALLLGVFGVLPGLLYLLRNRGYEYKCPECKNIYDAVGNVREKEKD